MKRLKCAPKMRTVTEIIDGKDKLTRDYDLTEFDAKNINSKEDFNVLHTKMIIVKYMAMLNTLKLTQPLLTIFRDANAQREIVTVVLASLGFVHNRVHVMVNNFDSRMEFVVLENRENIIPGEPIVFTQNENDDFVCIIDRLSIMKMLERQFDTDMCMDRMFKEKNQIKMMKAFNNSGRKKKRLSSDYNGPDYGDIKLSEIEVTRYLTMLFIIEHAYCHYYIFKNYGAFNYFQSIIDHKMFVNKCKPTSNMSFENLLLSKIKFTIEETDAYKLGSSGGNKSSLGILSYNN
ncbi:ODV-EC27 [Buzura suppressaria nucleopolyhedrovirus]|uniref:ODV-EC27 n=1 Tax=Buzura suppressaria nuclear polyhedrosis virus TaxID=74320 RepID=W5VS20_NPVBS|nr:ODV-EC27 [Buzura suppressaria nucleopolyhedrovirus]AHH82607.1 ODV-EC27 [Buzura suppressaria nucleopolyhedrovirus]AKN90987.1 ODV-EC27 [Buzura suppressaria nucleopolyhedrovirus]QYF10597.1 occlusion-derived virus envelope/capsid protein 27 [Buzura suppressaria nucleopolyhedrovirus]